MQVFVGVIKVQDRLVEVTISAPDGKSITNIQELAEKAWRSVNKSITIGDVTVRVRGFDR
jgi:hypothetical protein